MATLDVSIHAPAWGATKLFSSLKYCRLLFQSTHPRGVRRGLVKAGSSSRASFNPRTRVGCDHAGTLHSLHCFHVSIHAPAWGATPKPGCGKTTVMCFNPRTRVGCDPGASAFQLY